jgi:hypothetical protein
VPAPKPEHTGVRRILHSYRWRRRFIVIGILLAVGIPGIWAGVHYSQVPNTAATGGKATIIAQPKSVPFRPVERRQVRKVLSRFLLTAVARKDVDAAWSLVGPGVREGLTRKQWDTGSIPVQPYPVSKHGAGQWDQVQYSYPHHVGLEVMLFPKPGSGQAAASADVDVVQRHGHWIVNYFMPNKYHGNPVQAKTKSKRHKIVHRQKHRSVKERRKRAAIASHPSIGPPKPAGDRPGQVWWALPLSILALIFVIPIGYGIYIWIRNRRAYNEYLSSRPQ